MGWDGWERRQVSEKCRLLYSNDDRQRETEKRKKLISREVEEVNGLTGLIRKEEEGKEERESQLSVNSSSFRSTEIE